MRFSKLRLNGFKSFVDPTDLSISRGLTGVVGPNGCGKSNLLEALRWVMGESRARAMRGAGMDDVIFAGTTRRPARSFAEVTLVLDNAQRLAPAMFNTVDQLEVTRRITRDSGSSYKVNDRDARARDVQMLFADASTGAQSPALVRQGQIAELIGAKPKARRRVLEEAAGISGLYQRRHEAELKLKAAEANLLRVDDVIEQLAARLAQLARQAKQVGRYRKINDELRRAEGMLLYRAWVSAGAAAQAAAEEFEARSDAASVAERGARGAGAARGRAEAALPALREEEAIASAIAGKRAAERRAVLADHDEALKTIETLKAQIDQMDRDAERAVSVAGDAAQSIASLQKEGQELRAADEGHEDRLAGLETQARLAAEALTAREAELSQATEDTARLAAAHQTAQRALSEAERRLGRARDAASTAREAMPGTQAASEDAARLLEEAREAQSGAVQRAETAEAALRAADDALQNAQRGEAEARAARAALEGELAALRAEMQALERLAARETTGAGQLLDQVRAEPGYEAALGAALAEDLHAPVIDAQARARGGAGWAELPPGKLRDAASGNPHDASPGNPRDALPGDAVPLLEHVDAPPLLARRLAAIGIVAREAGPALQGELATGQRLVSREGDLWRWDGLCMPDGAGGGAAAQRLRQRNRMTELSREIEALAERTAAAIGAHEEQKTRHAQASGHDGAARTARREAEAELSAASRALSRAEAERDRAESRLEAQGLTLRRHEDAALEAQGGLREAQEAVRGLEDLDAARTAGDRLRASVEAARLTMIARRSAAGELRRDAADRAARLLALDGELDRWRERAARSDGHVAEIEGRRTAAATALERERARPAALAARSDALRAELDEADRRRAAAQQSLAEGDAAARAAVEEERAAERAAGTLREARAAAEARHDAAARDAQRAADRIEEELDVAPDALLATLEMAAQEVPEPAWIEARIAELRGKREALGAVNLRAEADAAEVEEEHSALSGERGDLEAAIAALRTGISGLNKEGRERLLAAFEEVNQNFSMLFRHLFGGGEARLELVESDDPLDAGLEIMCQPPGKKLSTLSLLSGGEQTLTAMALIFAVFLANPAPICVLDEVDAPLDDANVTRFCDMLDEMVRRTETRFLVITHHAVTMARMDRLFGVTMGEQGVSQLVSVDLSDAAELVA
ncbi:chromosome segregation protein SMC [Profundibacterium mesophilum]|uniref:Chromosome partition protein Smc n=1 Tax=Profundibacterium mesophilum KAUST100406-0324 TaxID=1037889 RepID=A0A921NQN3_9RHOB|nr:chromosome segregation protein SMC [Profundibacterium mesophilum]KAF0675512.1 Chromosome partition protein Smc [Profundibacterium mesophilum KAUST100406-0324]